ncbi:TonB-dependent receptor [Pseudoalteromonas lipolytica]|uniref:TonB-dependent receptor n=1 Tax=Pseudoalteromonas lipolytica TaxID=570156 RepID=A0ABU8SZ25_9GAMM
MKRLNLTLSMLFLSSLFSKIAYAQGSSSAEDSSVEDSDEIEQILVTSTKSIKSVQDIGLSVAALNGSEVRKRGLNNIEDVIENIPGASFTAPAGGGVPVVIIRGVGLQNFRINDSPTTAIYVDEVYQTSVAEAEATLFDVERVEVLKGPQGGLYGRNAVGGAIQVISAKPNFDYEEGYFSIRGQTYGHFESEAVISGPLSDDFAYRLSAKAIKANEGYFQSVPGGFDWGADDKWAGRLQLGYRPNEDTNITLKLHGGADKSELPLPRTVGLYRRLGLNLGEAQGVTDTADGAILNNRADTANINYVCDAIVNTGASNNECETLSGLTLQELGIDSIYDSASLSKPKLDNSWVGASVLVESQFDDYLFTSISAFDNFEHGRVTDQDTIAAIQQEIDYATEIDAWSQEFRLGFDDDSDISWIVGASYSEDELTENSLMHAGGLLSLQLGSLTQISQIYEQSTTAMALFGHGEWRFMPELNLVIEGRYTDEEKTFDGGTYLNQVGTSLADINDKESYSAVSGKIGLEYSPQKDRLYYVSLSKGFKTGGFFGGFATSNNQLEPYDKEDILSYEVGFKSDFNDIGIRFNGSVFYYDRSDVQANGLDVSGEVAIFRLTNIGDVETKGAEMDLLWYITDNLFLSTGIAYVESEVTESSVMGVDSFRVNRLAPYEGTKLPNQPEWSSNVTLRYEDEFMSDYLWSVQMEYTYRSEQDLSVVFTEEESAFIKEDAYNLVNLRAGISSYESGWASSVYVTNLFDTEYRFSAGGSGPTGLYEIYGEPRIIGAEVSYRF